MKWSTYFIPTIKEVPIGTEAISHQLSLRAGLVSMLTSGVYSYLPLGLRVLNRIESIIREEMNKVGAIELLMPSLQPIDIWKQTGRDKVLNDVMFKFKDNKGRDMCLGPTHEEIITDLVKTHVQSYKRLPIILYQIQTKYRDELRTRFGIVRACEFIMKDAYSFDCDVAGMKKNYKLIYNAYIKIFKRMGLDAVVLEADSGAMGGDVSHEFMVPASIGEDTVVICDSCDFKGAVNGMQEDGRMCPKCKTGKLKTNDAIELGHIFQLGTKYSKAQNANFVDEDGKEKPIIMGCYGIGVSRVIAAIIEKNNDEKGIIWPCEVAPFDVEIIQLNGDGDNEITELSEIYYSEMQKDSIDVLLDDREERPGRKFNDADLIGIPFRVVVGKRNLINNNVEIKIRKTGENILVKKDEVLNKLKEILDNAS